MSNQSRSKALQAFVAFLATTTGRDKSCRLIQYTTKFVKALFTHLSSKKNNKEIYLTLAEKAELIGGSMGMTRKVLRWGRPIGSFRNIFVLLKSLSKKDKDSAQGFSYTYFRVLAEISLAFYFLFDHIVYLGRMKIVKNDKLLVKSDYFSNFFWLCECLSTIISDCIQIHVLQNKLAQESLSRQKTLEEINEIKEKIDNSILNIIRSIIDTPVALHFMNGKFLEPGFVGILGMITSLIGCYQGWPKK